VFVGSLVQTADAIIHFFEIAIGLINFGIQFVGRSVDFAPDELAGCDATGR